MAVSETPFSIALARGTIRGYVRQPRQPGDVVAILLPGWVGYCAGPHRILYEAAEALGDAGIGTLRFDYLGRGDSDGLFENTTFSSAVEDTRAVATYVRQELGAKALWAVGMCFGAAVGFRCCRLWQRVALWSAERMEAAPSTATRLSAMRRRGRQAVVRLLSPKSWWRLLSGKTSLWGAYRYYTQAEMLPYVPELPNEYAAGASAALFFGQRDPRLEEVRRTYESHCKTLGLPARTIVIPGADHSFCSVRAKAELIARTVEWFSQDKQGSAD